MALLWEPVECEGEFWERTPPPERTPLRCPQRGHGHEAPESTRPETGLEATGLEEPPRERAH